MNSPLVHFNYGRSNHKQHFYIAFKRNDKNMKSRELQNKQKR